MNHILKEFVFYAILIVFAMFEFALFRIVLGLYDEFNFLYIVFKILFALLCIFGVILIGVNLRKMMGLL